MFILSYYLIFIRVVNIVKLFYIPCLMISITVTSKSHSEDLSLQTVFFSCILACLIMFSLESRTCCIWVIKKEVNRFLVWGFTFTFVQFYFIFLIAVSTRSWNYFSILVFLSPLTLGLPKYSDSEGVYALHLFQL